MKKLTPILLAVCLLAAACGGDPPAPEAGPAPLPEAPAASGEAGRSLERLAVELVVDWADTDRVLESQAELERLLREALAAQAWAVEEVQVTISTAGGPTGDALAVGGVDAACLPEEDYEAREGDAFAVLAAPGWVLAVTGAREELDRDFRAALAAALLETEQGADFLAVYSPGAAYAAVP